MTNDMTRGNPVRLILAFMIPTYLGNIFQQFYNLVDSVVAGRYIGVNALAAIGSTTSLIFLVTGWLQGITSGFSIMVAQSFGAKDYHQMRRYVAMSVYLCVAFVVVMTAGLMIFNVPILRLMNTPDEIIGQTAAYMGIIYAGLCVTAAYNAFASVLRALGDGRSPLYFLIISAVINAGLDVLFIVKFHMGVEGCAYATVIAQGISALLCLVYIILKFDILKLQKTDFAPDVSMMQRLLSIGVPMGLQFSITAIGTIIVQSAINVFGADYIAGYAAAGKAAEHGQYHFHCFRRNDSNLCGTEPRRGPSGPGAPGRKGYPDHDPDRGSGILPDYSFPGREADTDLCGQLQDRGHRRGQSVF